jgi:hypothetical protein
MFIPGSGMEIISIEWAQQSRIHIFVLSSHNEGKNAYKPYVLTPPPPQKKKRDDENAPHLCQFLDKSLYVSVFVTLGDVVPQLRHSYLTQKEN